MKRLLCILAAALVLLLALTGCQSSAGEAPAQDDSAAAGFEPFTTFQAQDFDGSPFTEDMFRDHAVTVFNFWFTGCIYCIQEMPELESLSHEWAEKDAALYGVCVDAGQTEELDELARQILSDNGVTYPNLSVGEGSAFWDYIDGIYGYPTTILIDREGKIVGEPIVGALLTQEQIDDVNARIDAIIEEDGKS